MNVGTPLRFELRDRAAQSRGEWPGVSWTLLRELGVSMREGGAAREARDWAAEERGGPRFGRGPARGGFGARREEEAEREGGGIRLDDGRDGGGIGLEDGHDGGGMRVEGVGIAGFVGADARWAELRAGKTGGGRLSSSSPSSSPSFSSWSTSLSLW